MNTIKSFEDNIINQKLVSKMLIRLGYKLTKCKFVEDKDISPTSICKKTYKDKHKYISDKEIFINERLKKHNHKNITKYYGYYEKKNDDDSSHLLKNENKFFFNNNNGEINLIFEYS